MKNYGSQTTGRRSRRGSRRRRHRGGESRGHGRRSGPSSKKKQGFFAALGRFFSSLFGGTGKAPSKSALAKPARDAAAKRPERAERSTGSGSGRKPELVEVTSPRLYVGNLSYDATESDLFELFNGVGNVQNAEVVSHKNTQRSKGFAFVQMQSLDEARRAVEVLHDKEFLGRKLVVSGAKPESGDSDS